MFDPYEDVNDNRLTPEDFSKKFGEMASMSLWGARWVGSAILARGHVYMYFDHSKGDYARG